MTEILMMLCSLALLPFALEALVVVCFILWFFVLFIASFFIKE